LLEPFLTRHVVQPVSIRLSWDSLKMILAAFCRSYTTKFSGRIIT
jgi:hypothetical protein